MRYVFITVFTVLLVVSGTFLYRYIITAPLTCESRQPILVAYGDSLVSGYGVAAGEDTISRLGSMIGVTVRNLGVSGNTSAQALARIETVVSLKPDIVVVLVGGNDALRGVPISETEANIGEILATLKAADATPVLVGVMGGFVNDPFRPMFERLALKYDVVLVPNILAGLVNDQRFMSDAIHPNAAGYARIAERLAPVIESTCGVLAR